MNSRSLLHTAATVLALSATLSHAQQPSATSKASEDVLDVIGLGRDALNGVRSPSQPTPTKSPSAPAAPAPSSPNPPIPPIPPAPDLPPMKTGSADTEASRAAADAMSNLIGQPVPPEQKVNITPEPAPPPLVNEAPRLAADPSFEAARQSRIREADDLAGDSFQDLSDRRISLIEAVRMTLSRDPVVQLAMQDVKAAEASLLSIQGSFDHRLSAFYDYRNQTRELTDAEKDKARADYQSIRELYETANIMLKRVDDVRSGKTNPSDFDLDGTPFTDPTSALNGGTAQSGATQQEIDIGQLENIRDAQIDAIIQLLSTNVDIPDAAAAEKLARQAVLTQEKIFVKMRDGALRSLETQPPWIHSRTETQNYEMAILRRFRGGPQVRLFANVNSTETALGTRSGDPRTNRSAVGLDFSINLTKLGLADPLYAQERAASQDLSARRELARDRTSNQALATVQAYWNLAAAQERLERLFLSELETLASTTIALQMIEGDILPRSEASQIEARQMQAVANRFAGEIELAVAQQALAVTIGIDPEEAYVAPLASDPLPPLSPVASLKSMGAVPLIRHTLGYHPNLVAFRYLTNANLILQEQARRDLLPDFKINVGGDFSGYNQQTGLDGAFGVWGSNHIGPSFFVVGSVEWPFENRTRRGALLSSEIGTNRTRLLEDQARRQLATQVSLSFQRVINSALQGMQLEGATKRFAEGLNVERQKLQGGTATAVDIIFAEQNLTNALLQEISARLAHATSIAELRQNSFTLLPPFSFGDLERGQHSIRLTTDSLTSVPTELVLSQYRLPEHSVNAAADPVLHGTDPLGPKPKPLLNRLFGGPETAATPASGTLTTAPAPMVVSHTPAPTAVAPTPQTFEAAAPAAPVEAPQAQKPKPLLKKLFGRD